MPNRKSSVSIAQGQDRTIYRKVIAVGIAGLSLTLFFIAFPIAVDAFWPFLSTRAAFEDVPSLHDTSVKYLDAAVNSDPNPSKGNLSIAMTEESALLPNGGPVGAFSSASFAATPEVTTYEVREGDSVSEIADMFGVSVATILSANDIEDAKTIQPGDTLRILPMSGVEYTIKRGGTVSDVAELFDVSVESIASANGLTDTDELKAGDTLIIPGGTLSSTKTTAKKTVSSGSSGVAVVKKVLQELSGYFGNPVPGAYVSQGIHGNNGVDLAGISEGTPVYAAAGGTVTAAEVGDYNGGYGNYVDVSHDNGTMTRYAHLSSVAVSVGQVVAKGEHLGGIGHTGRSTGNHLHFEVRGAKNPFAR